MHFDLEERHGVQEIVQRLRNLPTETPRRPPWKEFKRRKLARQARLQRYSHQRRVALAAASCRRRGRRGCDLWSQLSSSQHTLAQLPVTPLHSASRSNRARRRAQRRRRQFGGIRTMAWPRAGGACNRARRHARGGYESRGSDCLD